jgi:hypothetical protein
MTKREFDALNKVNYGCHMGARTAYRASCGHDLYGRDRLAERACLRARNPHLSTLGIGSPLRAPTEWRLLRRLPRIPYTHAERAALTCK